ncbi:MBL fold metallo-hydrolase [Mycoplasmatota bacterium WC30]
MKKLFLEEDILMFQFEPEEGATLGVNIFAIFNGDKYLLVDVGYEHHMKKALKEIDKDKCEYVILTHFHPDHVYGLTELNNPTKIGSIYGKETLSQFSHPHQEKLVPDIEVSEEYNFEFGRHKFFMHVHPGHSKCIMRILLNDKYLFVGDEIMFTNDGKSVLPYCASTLEMHLKGLKKLKKIVKDYTLLPAHGSPIDNHDYILHEIDKRIKYLSFFIKNKGSYEDFEKQTGIEFASKKWHKHNLEAR